MNAVDTNVLICAHDPRDEIKRSKALDLVASLDDGVLIWQVACEFLAASRKPERIGYRQQGAPPRNTRRRSLSISGGEQRRVPLLVPYAAPLISSTLRGGHVPCATDVRCLCAAATCCAHASSCL